MSEKMTVPDNWIRFDFTNAQSFKGTKPTYCRIDDIEIQGTNWAKVFVALVEREIATQNPALKSLYKAPLLDSRTGRPFFLKEDIEYLNCSRLSNGYWVCVNASIPSLMGMIYEFCRRCGYEKKQIVIYGVPKENAREKNGGNVRMSQEKKSNLFIKSVKELDGVEDWEKNLVNVLRAMLKDFPNGFTFDDSCIRILEKSLETCLDDRILNCVKSLMFERRDGVYFLNSFIDQDGKDKLLEQVNRYMDLNSGFEVNTLYDNYRHIFNPSCIRGSEDFEDWLVDETFEEVKTTSIGKFRIARSKSYRTDDKYISDLLQKIRDVAKDNYGTIDEGKIFDKFDGFSLDFLSYIVKLKADDIFVKEINETVCFQTFEGLGIPDDFSTNVSNALDTADKLKLSPSIDVLNALLAVDLGYNLRDEYGINEDRAFRKLIEVTYKGSVIRQWKANVFGKDED